MLEPKAVVLAVVLLCSAVATPASAGSSPAPAGAALATAPERRVPLDVARTRLATVTVRGERYRVYRYDNVFPNAGGVEMYRNGVRVSGEATARAGARAVAWRRAADRFDEEDIESLRRTRDSLRDIEQLVQPPIDALTATLAVRSRLQNESAKGVSAWAALRTKAPTLIIATEGIRALRNELQTWKELSRETGTDLDYIVTSLERLRDERDVNYVRLERTSTAAQENMAELHDRSLDLSARLGSAGQAVRTLADTSAVVPEVGGEAEAVLGDAADTIAGTSGDLDRFAQRLQNQRARLAVLNRAATTQQEALMDAWHTRQSATLRVVGSVGLVAAGLVGVGVVIRRRRTVMQQLRRIGGRVVDAGRSVYYGDALLDDSPATGRSYCPACGTDLHGPETPTFCSRCGTRLDVDEPTYHEPRDE